jgi:hypothetical protein
LALLFFIVVLFWRVWKWSVFNVSRTPCLADLKFLKPRFLWRTQYNNQPVYGLWSNSSAWKTLHCAHFKGEDQDLHTVVFPKLCYHIFVRN